MKFTLEIECDNIDNDDEVERNLRQIAQTWRSSYIRGIDRETLTDANGNPVGKWALTD